MVLAAIVYSQARNLDREALMGIGPGYFPLAFSALLAALGLTLLGSAWLTQSEPVKLGKGIVPAVLITAGVILFGLLLHRGGVVIAVAALVLIATRASHTISLMTAIWISAALALIAALLFRVGLGVPFPIFPSGL